MRVYILDNSGEISTDLLSWLADNKKVTELAFFDDTSEFLEKAGQEQPELVFIKLGVADISGLKVANKLKEINSEVRIVFISEETGYAVDAYDIGANGYLLAPIEKKKFDKMISIIQDELIEDQVKQYLESRRKSNG